MRNAGGAKLRNRVGKNRVIYRLFFFGLLSISCSTSVCNLNIGTAVGADVAGQRVDFNRQIRPILSEICYHCHDPDAENRDTDLRLDTFDGATADLGEYAAIVPGDADESEILTRLISEDPDERMPPHDSGKEVSAEQIKLLRKWIDESADWPTHWSFVPPERAPVPQGIDHRRLSFKFRGLDQRHTGVEEAHIVHDILT